MAARYKIYDIARIAGRTVFFDANVLIHLFWPTGSQRSEREYANLLSACLHHGIPIVVDFIVVSETVNRILRFEYDKFLARQGLSKSRHSFKDFRNGAEGIQAQADAFAVLGKNLRRFSAAGKAFTLADIIGFLKVDGLDMTDKAIVSLCSDKGYVLATHDADFAGSSVDIISANPAYN